MIRVHVQHFLNNEGIIYFPIWFNEIEEVIKKQPGFMAIKFWLDDIHWNCINIQVDFENDDLRNKWSTCDLHKTIVNKLDQYRTQSYRVERFLLDVNGNRDL